MSRHAGLNSARPAARAGGAPAPAGRGPRFPARGRAARGRPRISVFGSHPVLGVLAILATAVVTGMALTAYAAYRSVYDSIHHVNVTKAMLGPRPPKLNGSLNILIIGSDSRAGTHGKYGHDIPGARSDTSMIMHISPDHRHVTVVSFPRDSMVPIYSCLPDSSQHPGQQAQPGQLEQLNATFSFGGPACLWKTLEQTTRIRIDHFIEVDFTGFKQIVDDIGGVPVCLPIAIHDPASGLHLSAGRHVVDGSQALAFVRERHIGEGSDLQRIQRQQYFLASAAQKIKSSGILGNPLRAFKLVHDIASSLTTDSGLTVSDMWGIAASLKNLSTSAIRFITVPVVPYPPNPAAWVEWAQPAANKLFRAIREDSGISRAARIAARAGHATAAPTVAPSRVQVRVLNGSGVTGIAGTTARQLAGQGFRVTGTGDAASFGYFASVIEYGSPSELAQADTLRAKVPGAQLKQVSGLPGGALTLILGSQFKGLRSQPAAPAKQAARQHRWRGNSPPISKSYGGITGSANICKDANAFAGPDNPSMWSGS
jgi:LCP family protein required for cell wall assembly